jgi:hypothetical protein
MDERFTVQPSANHPYHIVFSSLPYIPKGCPFVVTFTFFCYLRFTTGQYLLHGPRPRLEGIMDLVSCQQSDIQMNSVKWTVVLYSCMNHISHAQSILLLVHKTNKIIPKRKSARENDTYQTGPTWLVYIIPVIEQEE